MHILFLSMCRPSKLFFQQNVFSFILSNQYILKIDILLFKGTTKSMMKRIHILGNVNACIDM